MNEHELWEKSKLVGEYDAYSFGDDELLNLVLKGIKRGTSSCYDSYLYEGEDIPSINGYSILLDNNDNARCIIKNKRVLIIPYKDITSELAGIEGEGDKSLSYWKSAHEPFFKEELRQINKEFSLDTLVVFEEFELVYVAK